MSGDTTCFLIESETPIFRFFAFRLFRLFRFGRFGDKNHKKATLTTGDGRRENMDRF